MLILLGYFESIINKYAFIRHFKILASDMHNCHFSLWKHHWYSTPLRRTHTNRILGEWHMDLHFPCEWTIYNLPSALPSLTTLCAVKWLTLNSQRTTLLFCTNKENILYKIRLTGNTGRLESANTTQLSTHILSFTLRIRSSCLNASLASFKWLMGSATLRVGSKGL